MWQVHAFMNAVLGEASKQIPLITAGKGNSLEFAIFVKILSRPHLIDPNAIGSASTAVDIWVQARAPGSVAAVLPAPATTAQRPSVRRSAWPLRHRLHEG
jgi:hypothetical protein